MTSMISRLDSKQPSRRWRRPCDYGHWQLIRLAVLLDIAQDATIILDFMLQRFTRLVGEMRVYPDRMRENLFGEMLQRLS